MKINLRALRSLGKANIEALKIGLGVYPIKSTANNKRNFKDGIIINIKVGKHPFAIVEARYIPLLCPWMPFVHFHYLLFLAARDRPWIPLLRGSHCHRAWLSLEDAGWNRDRVWSPKVSRCIWRRPYWLPVLIIRCNCRSSSSLWSCLKGIMLA